MALYFHNRSKEERENNHLMYANASCFYEQVKESTERSGDIIDITTDDPDEGIIHACMMPDTGAPELEAIKVFTGGLQNVDVFYMHLDAKKQSVTISHSIDGLTSEKPAHLITESGGLKSNGTQTELFRAFLKFIGHGWNTFNIVR